MRPGNLEQCVLDAAAVPRPPAPRPAYPIRCAVGPGPRAGDPEEQTEGETATLTRLARPWNVIVHDDPVTLMSYVVEVFREVFGYSAAKSRKLMLEVHHTGRCVVWTGERERAEIYVSKLQARHLLATLEQVDDV